MGRRCQTSVSSLSPRDCLEGTDAVILSYWWEEGSSCEAQGPCEEEEAGWTYLG